MSPPLSTTAPLPTQGDAKTAPKGMKPGLWSQEPFYPFTGTLEPTAFVGTRSGAPQPPYQFQSTCWSRSSVLATKLDCNTPRGNDVHKRAIPASCHPEEPPQSLPHVSLGQIYKPSGTPGWSYGSNLPQTRRNILPTTLLRLVGAW